MPDTKLDAVLEDGKDQNGAEPKQIPPMSRHLRALAGASVRFVTTILGAAIGSFVVFYLTINYVERFKAEESLRTFAFTHVYQPLKAAVKQCQEVRSRASQNAGIIHFTNELLANYLASAADGQGMQALQPLFLQMKDLIDSYSKASIELSKSIEEIRTCEKQVENAGHDLATVLNINRTYEELVAKQVERRPTLPDLEETENFASRLLGNPVLVSKLTKAFQDARDGDQVRAVSALSAIRTQLAKSSSASNERLEYQTALLRHGQVLEKELTELFLRNFRARFETTPSFPDLGRSE